MPTIPETTSTTHKLSLKTFETQRPWHITSTNIYTVVARLQEPWTFNLSEVPTLFRGSSGIEKKSLCHNARRPRQSIKLDSRCVSVVRPDGIDCHVAQCLALPTFPTRHRPTPSCSCECQPMLKRWLQQKPFEEPYQPRR